MKLVLIRGGGESKRGCHYELGSLRVPPDDQQISSAKQNPGTALLFPRLRHPPGAEAKCPLRVITVSHCDADSQCGLNAMPGWTPSPPSRSGLRFREPLAAAIRAKSMERAGAPIISHHQRPPHGKLLSTKPANTEPSGRAHSTQGFLGLGRVWEAVWSLLVGLFVRILIGHGRSPRNFRATPSHRVQQNKPRGGVSIVDERWTW